MTSRMNFVKKVPGTHILITSTFLAKFCVVVMEIRLLPMVPEVLRTVVDGGKMTYSPGTTIVFIFGAPCRIIRMSKRILLFGVLNITVQTSFLRHDLFKLIITNTIIAILYSIYVIVRTNPIFPPTLFSALAGVFVVAEISVNIAPTNITIVLCFLLSLICILHELFCLIFNVFVLFN